MTLLNVSDLSHHYAHGGFSGKHQHQAVLNNVSLALKSGGNYLKRRGNGRNGKEALDSLGDKIE